MLTPERHVGDSMMCDSEFGCQPRSGNVFLHSVEKRNYTKKEKLLFS